MNTKKWKVGNHGLLSEADRTMYANKDTVSRSIIDRERTHLNYNLCPHEQYTMGQIKDINRKIRGKELAKNAIAWGSTVITVPQDYEGDLQAFFKTAYDGLQKLYKLKDEDIISAYVHMDETTPHMHFYFIPVAHREKDCVNWNKVMPKWMYDTQHQVLQRYMEDKLHTPVNIRNGNTKGIDLSKMTADEKQLSMRVEKLRKDVSSLRKRKNVLMQEAEEVYKPLERLQQAIQHLLQQLLALKPKEREKEKDLFDWLEKNGRKFGKDLDEINATADYIEQQSSRIESENSVISDDDFGMDLD